MATKRAKTLTEAEIEEVLRSLDHSPIRECDRLKVLLTFYAGLRVSEVAKLRVDDMLEAGGRISKFIRIFSHVGKNKKERVIPMHPAIRTALQEFRRRFPDAQYIAMGHTTDQLSASGLTAWFHRIYKRAGFKGCSSHSGRRTFITTLSRTAPLHGNSLRDVQLLAGHARLNTTEGYIDPAESVVGLVSSLASPSGDTNTRRPRYRRGGSQAAPRNEELRRARG